MPFTHIDCFSGPGGFCTGLHAAGFDTKVAIEYVQSCMDTYSANHQDVEYLFRDDITNIHTEGGAFRIPDDLVGSGVDLVTSGMPCETFSTAGNSSRASYDERQVLYRQGLRIAKIVNAKMILFENVPAITSKKLYKDRDELVIDVIRKDVAEAGYYFKEFTLRAVDFGIPQTRERFFLLAIRKDLVPDDSLLQAPLPEDILSEIRSRTGLEYPVPVTVRDAFTGLPDAPANSAEDQTEYTGEESDYSRLMKDDKFWRREDYAGRGLTFQHPNRHRAGTIKRMEMLRPGEKLGDLFDRLSDTELKDLQKSKIMPKKKFIGRNIKLMNDGQSPTVTSHCLDEMVHPDHPRALTVRECARLQSFPDSYVFEGPYLVPHLTKDVQDKFEQIGDAVPPLLSFSWGIKISQILEELK